ncbi:MAG TPA: hypothetical protein VFJ84_01740, partial [Candidatus Saccharimonadales bacterium]|nr:hypothetical protein [Candidatus Saccharimonadales bacterium]
IDGGRHSLPPNTTLSAELHSDPIELGSFTLDPTGNFSSPVLIPFDTPTGYHTIHFYGTDITGQKIDIFKTIFVGGTADDIDGNEAPDRTQGCIFVIPSGQDYDQDGVDDACDGTIDLPRTDLSDARNSPVVSKTSTVQTIPVVGREVDSSKTSTYFIPNTSSVLAVSTRQVVYKDTNSKTQVASDGYLFAGMGFLGTSILGLMLKRFVF